MPDEQEQSPSLGRAIVQLVKHSLLLTVAFVVLAAIAITVDQAIAAVVAKKLVEKDTAFYTSLLVVKWVLYGVDLLLLALIVIKFTVGLIRYVFRGKHSG